MPVADSDPHPLTIRTASTSYGCFNGDRSAKFYWAPVRVHNPDGSFTMGSKQVRHAMSHECRYDKSLTDPRCRDCKHQGSGEAYSARISAAVAK